MDVVLELLVPVETSGSRWEADTKGRAKARR